VLVEQAVYTNDPDRMVSQLTTDITKSAAVEVPASKDGPEIPFKNFAVTKTAHHPVEEIGLHI
jgi:hypothetical protein